MQLKPLQPNSPSWLDQPVFKFLPGLSVETFITLVILFLAVFSRLYDVGVRVMSHDEVNHVVPAYDLYQGRGYRYDPVTHGPLQFHMMALSFFVLGDSDTSARMPAALFGIGLIAFVVFAYRRFLGRVGSLVAGFLLLISPYLLFYSRYTRNEIYIAFWAAALLFAVLAYVHSGKARYLFLFTVITAFHFTDKATSYIFAAEIMLFLLMFFIERVLRKTWDKPDRWRNFIYALVVVILFAAIGIGLYATGKAQFAAATPTTPAVSVSGLAGLTPLARIGVPIALLGVVLGAAAAIYFIITGLGWKGIRDERAFDLLILQGTIVLPLSASIFIKMAGFDPMNYTNNGLLTSALFMLPLTAAAIAIGLWWRPRVWLVCMAIFWAIFIVFYSTFFTNGLGIPMGLVAALGYWMSQQTVQRGSQPLYYYLLVQLPTYEFLPALGTLLAIYLGIRHKLWLALPNFPFKAAGWDDQAFASGSGGWSDQKEIAVDGSTSALAGLTGVDPALAPLSRWLEHVKDGEEPFEAPAGEAEDIAIESESPEDQPEELPLRPVPTLALLAFWSLSSLAAFSVAGERMPWLTVHIALPMILTAGWGLGYLIESTHWGEIRKNNGLVSALLVGVLLASLAGALASLLGANPPFQGKTIEQLQSSSIFLTSVLVFAASAFGLTRLLTAWRIADVMRLGAFIFFGFLAVLTIRTSLRAAYVNYDTALEYMVYAHAARGPKDVLAQIAEISYRTTGGNDVVVAYDNDVNYPYWWYLRSYPNKVYYGDKPTRELRNYPIVVAGGTIDKVEPILGDAYYKFDYKRLWWPMQDYFDLNWDRIRFAITDPQMRNAVFQIWFNRNYQPYAELLKRDNLTLAKWEPSNPMRLYIRKDIVAQMWKYGVAAAAQPAKTDPYAAGKITLAPSLVVGTTGAAVGQLNAPRQVAFASDGTFYVADSRNNRIQHFSVDGAKVINQWGTFADVSKGSAPGGTLYEPWGIAVGPDGSVYVADTWNNRIQKFTADGKFVSMWGYFGEAEKPEAFWGPRGLAFDGSGRLYVTDTGNKRVVVFGGDGKPITSFGGAGAEPGQFDEPVGVAVDKDGKVYVADTWNQRVQVFAPDATGKTFSQVTSWNIDGWFGQSIENKPYLAVDTQGHVFVTDPEAFRVLEFKSNGDFVHTWGDYGTDQSGIGEASAVAVDGAGNVWVSDAANMHLLRFPPPVQ